MTINLLSVCIKSQICFLFCFVLFCFVFFFLPQLVAGNSDSICCLAAPRFAYQSAYQDLPEPDWLSAQEIAKVLPIDPGSNQLVIICWFLFFFFCFLPFFFLFYFFARSLHLFFIHLFIYLFFFS